MLLLLQYYCLFRIADNILSFYIILVIQFGGFRATNRIWKFTVISTYTGSQPTISRLDFFGIQENLSPVDFYAPASEYQISVYNMSYNNNHA